MKVLTIITTIMLVAFMGLMPAKATPKPCDYQADGKWGTVSSQGIIFGGGAKIVFCRGLSLTLSGTDGSVILHPKDVMTETGYNSFESNLRFLADPTRFIEDSFPAEVGESLFRFLPGIQLVSEDHSEIALRQSDAFADTVFFKFASEGEIFFLKINSTEGIGLTY